jgi:Secretion system C-terminal sorting domain
MYKLYRLLICNGLFFIFLSSAKASPPDWSVQTKLYSGTMTMTGIIEVNSQKGKSADDIVGVFVGNVCRGVAKPIFSQALNRYLIFLSVFGNDAPEKLTYKIYLAAEDKIYEGREAINYELNATAGKIDLPYFFRNALALGVPDIPHLESFNVYPNPLIGNELSVTFQLLSQETDLVLTLHDAMNRCIFCEKISRGNSAFFQTFNLSEYQSGMYFLTLGDQFGNCSIKKIIKL